MTSYNNLLNGAGTAMSRRRPKRQRTPTTIYSDDKPSTFTTKKKKGDKNNNDDNAHHDKSRSGGSNHEDDDDDDADDDDLSYSKQSPAAGNNGNGNGNGWSSTALEETSSSMPPPAPVVTTTKRGPGRPPRKRSSGGYKTTFTTMAAATAAAAAKTVVSDSSASLIATTSTPVTLVTSEDSSSTYTTTTTTTSMIVQTTQLAGGGAVVKRKRGRPKKNRSRELSVMSDESCSTSTDDHYQNNQDLNGDISVDVDGDGDDDDETVATATDNDNNCPTPTKSHPRRHSHSSSGTLTTKTNHNSRYSKSISPSSLKLKLKLKSNSKSSSKSIHLHKDKNRITTITSSRKKSSSNKSSIQRTTTKTAAGSGRSDSWTSPQEDIEGTFINHSVTLAPILPPSVLHNNDNNNGGGNSSSSSRDLKSRYPAVFDSGVPKVCSGIASLFPSLNQTSSGTSSLSSSKHNQSQQPQLPTWTPLYDPPVYFEDDYDQETGKLDVGNTRPVTRHITAITVRKPDHDYLVLGDSVGFVTIYNLAKDNINIPIAQLESVACQQRGKMEQERLRAELRKRREKKRSGKGNSNSKSSSGFNNGKNGIGGNNGHSMGRALFSSSAGTRPGTPNQFSVTGSQQSSSILMDTSETTIHALGMIENRVVLATSEELECMDVPSGTSLWVCPLSSNRFVTSLDMHLRTFDVLVSCSKTTGGSSVASDDSTEAAAAPISPLMLLQHSKNNVEICDANSPMLVRSPSCSAIWDIGAQNRLLFIALSSNRQELELVLVSGGSIDSWKVACKTKIPTKAATSVSAVTKLSQSPGGIYTLVASSRGIRLYQTESLQLIHVYGDQLALHGQAVMWKDCWLAGSYFSETNGVRKASRGLPSQWLECDDWLGQSSTVDKNANISSSKEADINNMDQEKADNSLAASSSTPDLAPYIIGVPHTKGPIELCDSLHVWKVEHPSVVPTLSIPLPPKGNGALGLVGGGNRNNTRNDCNTGVSEDRIVLVTNNGRGHMLLPEMESNFAGIMYPPGYQVITDNIEYIEEEDAMDHVVTYECPNNDEEEDVDVLGHGEDDNDDDDDDLMDEELKEAMRQSLLEHKRQEITREAMKHDQDVDILPADSEKAQHYLPCRPEPYLRQMVNTIVEGDGEPGNDEQDEKSDGRNSGESLNIDMGNIDSSSETLKPQISGATFISNVLDIMPNMQKPKPLEEDCLSFTTTKVVVAVNPVLSARQGRGRKSRAANLDTMLKSSINPYLQSMMLSKQGVAVDGVGSRLRPIKVIGNRYETNKSTVLGANVKQMTPSSGSLADAAESQSNGQVRRDNGGSFSSGSSRAGPNYNSDIGSGTSLRLDRQPNISPRQATNADEAAVVMGLLGLSPCNTAIPIINNAVSAVSREMGTGANANVFTKFRRNGNNESAYLSASSLSSLVEKTAVNQVATGTAESLSSDRESSDGTEEEVVEKPILGIIDKSCSACRGRNVIHSCGKRSLPIDYEEVARAERESKAKEEEEKKRIRSEKRRLADQKRREKKQRQRELEEQRLREVETSRSETEQHVGLQDDFASSDLNRQRREQIVASYANHISIDQLEHQPQVMVETNSVDYAYEQQTSRISNLEGRPEPQTMNLEHNPSQQGFCNVNQISGLPVATNFDRSPQPQPQIHNKRDEVSQPNIFEQAAQLIQHTASDNRIESSVSVLSSSHVPLTIPAQSPLVQAALPSVSATLASADALLGLANLADLAENTLKANTLPSTVSHTGADTSNTEWPAYNYGLASSSTTREPATDKSRGFGASEDKLGIPSYATIRCQLNSGNSNDSSTTATPAITTTAANPTFSNGNGFRSRESHPWSSRSEEHNQR